MLQEFVRFHDLSKKSPTLELRDPGKLAQVHYSYLCIKILKVAGTSPLPCDTQLRVRINSLLHRPSVAGFLRFFVHDVLGAQIRNCLHA